MGDWSIEPDGVSTVLANVQGQLGAGEEGGGLSQSIERAGEQIERALEYVKSPPIEAELLRFLGDFHDRGSEIFLHGLSCLTGASEATQSYIDGDQEMALEAQRSAGDVDNLDLDAG